MKKIIEYLWYIVITTAIWGTSIGGINVGVLGTMSPFRIIIILLTMMVIIKEVKNHEKIEKSNIILILISFLVLGYNLFFVINNNEYINLLQKILNYAYGLLLLILGKKIVKEDEIFKNTIKVIAINFIVICIWGLYESFTGNYIFSVNERTGLKLNSFGLYPPVVAFFNTNGLATFLIMMLPCIYSEPIFKRNITSTIFRFGIVIISLILLLLAGARAACMILLAFIFMRVLWKMKDKKKIALCIAIVGCVILASLTIWKIQTDILINEIFSISNNDNSTSIRINLIKNGLLELEKSNFLGIGMGNFEIKMQKYNNTDGIINAHNLLLEMLVENGIIVFSIIVFAFFNMILKIIKKYKQQDYKHKDFMINIIFLILTFPLSTSINSTTYAFMPMWIMITIFTIIANNHILEGDKR